MPQAVWIGETGGAEMLRIDASESVGVPGPGQARVAVAAAGVNFIDVYFRTGLYPRPLPYVAGLEGAGEIEAVKRAFGWAATSSWCEANRSAPSSATVSNGPNRWSRVS